MKLMCNKRNMRLWLLLVLLALATLLLWQNLDRARVLNWPKGTAKTITTTQPPRHVRLQQLLKCRNRSLRLERLQHGAYWLIQNLVVGHKSRHMGCAESITYTTHGDYSFFNNLEAVTERWLGPISFAIYAPGHDLNATLDAIQYVRNCLPSSLLINDYVTFHIYFPNDHMPPYVPYDEQVALNWPFSCVDADGSLASPPYELLPHNAMYKVQKNMTYPINVGRNIARMAANTHFIFACDIELYPSPDFVEQFLDMIARNHSVLAFSSVQAKRVYPLPVFELQHNESLPSDKEELLTLLEQKRAQLFHARLCAQCHRVPGHQKWMQDAPNATDELEVISVGLRMGAFRSWEPFYVSDNTEPMFDERVTWEGQSNKRIQGYAMCLLGYEYHVLHPAFLVHHPGIQKPPSSKSPRLKSARQMTQFIKAKIKPEYRVLFGHNPNCTV